MYCSTCGTRLIEGRSRCDNCGAAVPRGPLPAVERAWTRPVAATACPRCGYRGEGVSYFSKGSHIALAVGLTLLTAGAMGAGGLIYYLVRRDHTICPRCGRSWGKGGQMAMVPTGDRQEVFGLPSPAPTGGGKQAGSVLLFVLAAAMIAIGFAAEAFPPFLIAGVAATAGVALSRAAANDRARRREALINSLQLPVLQLAGRSGGQLTVTQVAAELGWTLRRAEKVLQSLDDGLRVTSDVTDEGVIVYDFRELKHLGPGNRQLEG